MIDSIDELILSALSKDAKQDLNEIWDFLRTYGHNLSLEEIDSRIKTLEDEKIISRYKISIDVTFFISNLWRSKNLDGNPIISSSSSS